MRKMFQQVYRFEVYKNLHYVFISLKIYEFELFIFNLEPFSKFYANL